MQKQLKTRDEARQEFSYRGETITGWAHKHGFCPYHVRDVLRGRAKGRFGESHKIAVKLGIKDGIIVE
jgi:gp16 family phage-associated protein